jgi:hypothetical protein
MSDFSHQRKDTRPCVGQYMPNCMPSEISRAAGVTLAVDDRFAAPCAARIVRGLRGGLLACAKLGFEYITITDHTRDLAMARGPDEKKLREQMLEIAHLNAKLRGFRILTGAEVNIRRDGSLDISDENARAARRRRRRSTRLLRSAARRDDPTRHPRDRLPGLWRSGWRRDTCPACLCVSSPNACEAPSRRSCGVASPWRSWSPV